MDLVLRVLMGCILFFLMGGTIDIRSEVDPKFSLDDVRRQRLVNVINEFRSHFNDFSLDPEKVYRTRRKEQFFVDLNAWKLQQKYGSPMYAGGKEVGTRFSKKIQTYFSCADRSDAVCYAVDMNNFAGQYIRGVQGNICSQDLLDAIKAAGVDSLGFYVLSRSKPLAICTNGMWLVGLGES